MLRLSIIIIEDTHIEAVSLHLRRRLHTFQRIAKEYYSDKQRRFILYIVHDNNIDNFKHKLTKLFENENCLEVELRFFEFNYLLDKFGFEK